MGGRKFRALHTSAATVDRALSNPPCKPKHQGILWTGAPDSDLWSCPKVQLIWPPRNCSGFKTESHIGKLKVSKALFDTECKIYTSLLHQSRHVHWEDVQTQATTASQRVGMEHKHN